MWVDLRSNWSTHDALEFTDRDREYFAGVHAYIKDRDYISGVHAYIKDREYISGVYTI